MDETIISVSKQTILSLIYRITSYILGFIADLIFARYLGANSYGIFSLGLTISGVLSVFSILGMPNSMIRFIGKLDRLDKEEIQKNVNFGFLWILFTSILLSILLFINSSWISKSLFSKPALLELLPFISILLVFYSLNKLLFGIFQSLELPNISIFIKEVFGRLSKLLLFLLFGYLLYSDERILAISFLIGEISVTCVFINIYMKIRKGCWGIFDMIAVGLPTLRSQIDIIRYSLAIAGSSIVGLLLGYLGKLVLGYYSSAEELAIFSISQNIGQIVLFGLSTVNIVVMPLASKLLNNKDKTKSTDIYQFSTHIISFITIPIYATILFYSKDILALYGEEFSMGVSVLCIMSSASFINGITGANYPFMIMSDYYNLEFWITLFGGVINAFVSITIAPNMGAVGVAIGYLCAQVFMNIARSYLLYKKLGLFPFSMSYLRYVIVFPLFSYLSFWFLEHISMKIYYKIMLFVLTSFLVNLVLFYINMNAKRKNQFKMFLFNKLKLIDIHKEI